MQKLYSTALTTLQHWSRLDPLTVDSFSNIELLSVSTLVPVIIVLFAAEPDMLQSPLEKAQINNNYGGVVGFGQESPCDSLKRCLGKVSPWSCLFPHR